MPTLREVAKLAGVSTMTASNALHGKQNVRDATRRKVIEAAEKLNYYANASARMLKSGRSKVIEVLLGGFDSPYYSKLADAFSYEIERNGYQASFSQTNYSAQLERLAIQEFTSFFCDGLIIATPLLSASEIRRIGSDKPLVLHEDSHNQQEVDSINLPNEDGALAAVRHLIALGCSHIAIAGSSMLGTNDLLSPDSPPKLRYRGCYRALSEAGIAVDPALMIPCDWYPSKAERAMDEYLDSHDAGTTIDAIFCMTDTVGFGIIKSLHKHGIKVPADIQVMGFDGTSVGEYLSPSLTTISVDMSEVARQAVLSLIQRIDGDDSAPHKMTVGFQLTERESTKRI